MRRIQMPYRDFNEFVALLNAYGAKYLIVGGYAMAGQDFGFGGHGLSAADFEIPDQVVQLGDPPFRIDLLTAIDGVDFDVAWPSRFEYRLGEHTIPFMENLP